MTQADPQFAEFAKAQHDEYNTWVAVDAINIGTARAFNAGDPVPSSTVERLGLEAAGLVAKRSTKAGKEVVEANTVTVDLDEFHRQDITTQSLVDPDAVKAATVKSAGTSTSASKEGAK